MIYFHRKAVKILLICHLMMGSLLSAHPIKNFSEVEEFWHILFEQYHFGYTLFGHKPLSFDRYYLVNSQQPWLFNNQNHFIISRLWPIWEQYSLKLINHNFVIKRVQFKEKDETLMEEFYLINKSDSLLTIRQYWEEFKEHFQHVDNPEQLLELICENGPHIIKNHRLLGLLLGYGDHNTHLFQKQHDLFEQLASLVYLQPKEILLSLPSDELINLIYARKQATVLPNSSWQSLWREYENTNFQLSSSLGALISYKRLLAIPLVPYRVDPSSFETKEILKNNLETQKVLKEIFYDRHFLEIVLKRLED